MKDPLFPARLGDSGDDPVLRELLGAAKADAMAPPRAARSLAAFEAAKVAGATGIGAGRPTWGWALPVKIGAPLAIVCAIGLGWGLRDATRAELPLPAAATVLAAPDEPAALAAPAAEERSAVRVDDLPSAAEAREEPAEAREEPATALARSRTSPASTSPASATAPAKAPAASSFHEELSLVEAARSALGRGDSESCLRALRRYEARFPSGVFAEEIVVMRVEALVARGDLARARAIGDAFLAKSPTSAYASRVRSLLVPPTGTNTP